MLTLFNSKLHLQSFFKSNFDKPLFIYLSGLDGSGKLLSTQTNLLKNFDVRALSIPKDDLSNWDLLSQNVIDLIKKELNNHQEKRTIYLCGESFGGCLALKLIETEPDLFNYLILVNPASSFNKNPLLNFGGILTKSMSNFIYINSTLILLPFLANLRQIESKVREDMLKIMQSVPPSIVSWRISLLAKFAVNESRLNQFMNQVLIVASGKDRLLPSLEEAERLSSIFPKNKIFILPDSGHSCLLEKDVDLYSILQNNNSNPVMLSTN